MKNIIYYLKQNVLNFPEKTAFCDERRKLLIPSFIVNPLN